MIRRRLARRLIVAIVLASSLITLVITSIQLYLEYDRDTAVIRSRLDEIEHSHLASVAQNVWLVDRPRLLLLLKGMCSLPDFTSAEVTADDGWTVVAGTPGQGLVRRYPLTMDYRGGLQSIGTLTVTASLDGVFQRLLARAGFVLLANGLKTALVAMVMYLLVERLITRRLAILAEQSQRIGGGDLATPLSLRQHEADEICSLGRALEDMRLALLQSAQHVQRKNRELEEFAWILAHHLQEPVRQQYLFAQRLETMIGNATDETLDALHLVQQGALRQRALLADVQRYLSLDQIAAVPESCSPAACLDRAVLRLNALIRNAGAKVVGGAMPPVWMDCERLTLIFVALIENSLSYRHPQRVPEIQVTATECADFVELAVADNGPGIPAAYREKVFRVFERLEPGDGRAATGIGLALVRKIVESAGGRVWLEDAQPCGTVVRFSVPAEPSAFGR